MSVPMLDLSIQNQAVKQKILDGIGGLIDRSSFILGDNVRGLEAEIAAYAGAKFGVGMSSGSVTWRKRSHGRAPSTAAAS